MKHKANLVDLLRERKLKATSTRLDVLSVISNYNKAIPFSEIQKALSDFDRVTLYRTIHALIKNGIIHKVLIEDKEIFFAMCSKKCTSDTHSHQHIHFKCTICHAVTCVEAVNSITLSIPGHVIENFEIAAKGVCVSCNH